MWWMLKDFQFAFRQIAKSPGFAIVTVLTLAIGIGANTAIFSIVNAVLLEPLPYPHSDRLVQVCEMPAPGNYNTIASGGAFVDWQDATTQLESIAAAHGSEMNLTGYGEPVRLQGLEVSADYLHVFGVAPALGRDFTKSEDSASGDHDVVIISHELWQSRLGGETAVVGRRIRLDGKSLLVIGVLPPHALFANDASFLTPSVIRPSEHHMSRDYNYVVSIVGRLKPGATAAQAAQELTLAKGAVRNLYPVFKQKWTVGVLSLHEEIFGDMRPYVLILFGAVAVVLLIACANVANLLLARATVRQSEIAVRVALGATSRRIVSQLLTESLVLALAGGVAGLLVGELAIRPLVTFAGITSTVGGSIGINARVLAFTLIASVATGVIFGLVPAITATKQDVSARLKEGARGSTAGSHRRMQALLLVSETALTVLLLLCAGLLLRSFVKAMNADPGFKADNVLVFNVSVPDSKAPSTAEKVRFYQILMERLKQVPGVTDVGIGASVPMNGGNGLGDLISREDRPETRNDSGAAFDSVAGDYFQGLRIPLLSGRFLTRGDDSEKAPKVLLVNDVLARKFFGNENPIGQQLHFKGDVWQIVGVVGSVRQFALEYAPLPEVYFAQTYFPWAVCVLVHTKVPVPTLSNDVRLAVRDVDPDLPLANMQTLETAVDATLQTRRIMLALIGIFAVTALMLACIGIYGVVSYSVAQRTREMGIRMALGADARSVIALILRQGIRLVLIGVGLGIAASLGAGILIANQLYGVSRTDPAVMAGVALILIVAAVLASWLPARRASRVAPSVALRSG
jgi:putative ABC transport system permease protein